jgi:hypothetical protein
MSNRRVAEQDQQVHAGPAKSWIVEQSESKVGRIWEAEDHELLVRTLKRIDEFAVELLRHAQQAATKQPWSADEGFSGRGIRSRV